MSQNPTEPKPAEVDAGPAMPVLPPTPLQKAIWSTCYLGFYCSLSVMYGVRRWGINHLPSTGPLLLLSNHQSFWDPMLVGLLMRQRGYFSMARSTLWKTALSRKVLAQLRSIPVSRSASDTTAMRLCVKVLAAGEPLLVFPEGTRTADGKVDTFKSGTMLLIRKARPPVVPVAIEGAYDVWPRTRKLPRLTGRIGVMCGEPVPAERLIEMGAEPALSMLQQQVESMRLQVRAMLNRCERRRPAAED